MEFPVSVKRITSTYQIDRGARQLSREERYLWEHATLLYRSYEWHAALEGFRSLVDVLTGARRAECLINVGLIHARLGEFDHAATSFERATKLSHCLDMSYFLLGVVEFQRSNMLMARACFEFARENFDGGNVTCDSLRPAHEITDSMSLHNINAAINNAKPSNFSGAISPSIIGIPPPECIFEVPTRPSQARQKAVDLLASRTQHREFKKQYFTQEPQSTRTPTANANEAERIERLSAPKPRSDIMFEPIKEHGADVLKWISAVGRSSSSSSASSRFSSLLRYYRKERKASHSDCETQVASNGSQKSKISEDRSTPPTSYHDSSFDTTRLYGKDLEVDSNTTLWSPTAHRSRERASSTDTIEFILQASRWRLDGQDAERSTSANHSRDQSPTRFLLSVERANRLRMGNQDWRMPSKNDKPPRRPPLLHRRSDSFAARLEAINADDPRLDDDGISVTKSVRQRDRAEALAILEGRTVTFSDAPSSKLRRYCLYKPLPPLPGNAFLELEPIL